MIQEASADSRNETAPATSSGTPRRFIGYAAATSRLTPLVERAGELGLDHGRGHRVDPHQRAELVAELGGEVDQRGLAHGVPAQHAGGAEPGDRGDVDDGPAGGLGGAEAAGDHLAGPAEGAEHVDLQDLAGGIDLGVEDRAVRRVDPRVVDQVVDPAEGGSGPLDHVVLVCLVVGAAGDAQRDLRAAEPGDRLLERVGLAAGEHDPAALLRPAGGRSPARCRGWIR